MKQEVKLIKYLVKEITQGGFKNEVIELFDAGISHKTFSYLLSYHELGVFLYFLLKEAGRPIPSYLADQYYRYLARYMILEKELLRIITAAENNCLLFVPIKGFSYSDKYYKGFGFRPLSDIDLLIKEDERDKACELMKKMGYAADFSEGRKNYWLKNQCHFEFIKTKNRSKILIELHWALDFKRGKKEVLPSLWKRLQKEEIAGRQLFTLSPEDAILSLALHQRRFGRMLNLKYVCDTGLILKNEKIDWDYLIKTSFQENMRASLYFLIRQTELVLDINLKSKLKRLKINWIQRKIIDAIIKKYTFSSPQKENIYYLYLLCHFLFYDNITYPLKYIFRIPLEQFAKFFRLPLYVKKTSLLYHLRFIYIPYKILRNNIEKVLEKVF